MNIKIASHYGMCFGVRDALKSTQKAAAAAPLTMLGQLVHNPLVDAKLKDLGVHQGTLSNIDSVKTQDVVISAHGAGSDKKMALHAAGLRVTDTTCPLVRKAHDALAVLVSSGYFPIIIGQASHEEVLGLLGDYPQSKVVLHEEDLEQIPYRPKFGVISQTTQPLISVLTLVDSLKRKHPQAEVRFIDTICQPTKQRQKSLEELCEHCDTIIIVGGHNSNNTRQLFTTATKLGAIAHQVECADEINPVWFHNAQNVGVTAGTSTLDETIRDVVTRLKNIATQKIIGLLE
ncbi:4-hydroxy-3-methylbut-2-enyl diphosphate reductase [soil metagenome]